MQKGNGFELGKVISDQRVSMLEISNSVLRLQFIGLLSPYNKV